MGLARFQVSDEIKSEVERLLARMQGIRSIDWITGNQPFRSIDDPSLYGDPDWFCIVEAGFFPEGSTDCTPIITTDSNGQVLTWNWDIEGVGHHRVDG